MEAVEVEYRATRGRGSVRAVAGDGLRDRTGGTGRRFWKAFSLRGRNS